MYRRAWLLYIAGFLVFVSVVLGFVLYSVRLIDPLFHYHAPYTGSYFYSLDDEMTQNDGILRHFSYEGVITGTSMSENFLVSEAEELWGIPFVKVPYADGSLAEINEAVAAALRYHPGVTTIIRSLDMNQFADPKDFRRLDVSDLSACLSDSSRWNDVRYLFDRDVFFTRIGDMASVDTLRSTEPGITSFDEYANWMDGAVFGKNAVAPDGIAMTDPQPEEALTDAQREQVRASVRQNVTALAEAHPEVTFYLFIPPYSALWWQDQLEAGTLRRQVEMERVVIEELLPHDNIRLFSLNGRPEITTNLNHYTDKTHCAEWINSLLLRCMRSGTWQITADNYETCLRRELSFYTNCNYSTFNRQVDYVSDEDAARLVESLPAPGIDDPDELEPDTRFYQKIKRSREGF